MKLIERVFEGLLWNSRLVTLVAVVASVVVALVMFYIASADVVYLAKEVSHYTALETDARERLHRAVVAHVAEIVDGYLFATILIIFALGLYELFISKIDAIESSPVASRVLLISSLDELKERLAKVVFLILIVRYFQYALESRDHQLARSVVFGGRNCARRCFPLSHEGKTKGVCATPCARRRRGNARIVRSRAGHGAFGEPGRSARSGRDDRAVAGLCPSERFASLLPKEKRTRVQCCR